MQEICNKLFDLLDDYRHLPAYQLERRADIFFALYLESVIEEKFKIKPDFIFPEFPIRIGSIHTNREINKSFKIDYLIFSKSNKRIFFVELKTDSNSRRDKQDWYLEKAKEVGIRELLIGLEKIYFASNSKLKYEHLIRKLLNSGLIKSFENKKFEISNANFPIEIVYIQPNNYDNKNNVIDFIEVAKIVSAKDDIFSKRFASSLITWKNIIAGNGQNT